MYQPESNYVSVLQGITQWMESKSACFVGPIVSPAMGLTKTTVCLVIQANSVSSLLTKNAYVKPVTFKSCPPSKHVQPVITPAKLVITAQLVWPAAQSTSDKKMPPINAIVLQGTTITETSCVSNAITDVWLVLRLLLASLAIPQPETRPLCQIVYAWLGSGTMASAVLANRVWLSAWVALTETDAQVVPLKKSWLPQRIVYACHEHTHQTASTATTTAKSAQIQPSSVQNVTEPQWDIWTQPANHVFATTVSSMMEVTNCALYVITLA
jgi:hypothetical protein